MTLSGHVDWLLSVPLLLELILTMKLRSQQIRPSTFCTWICWGHAHKCKAKAPAIRAGDGWRRRPGVSFEVSGITEFDEVSRLHDRVPC